jgi:hypothetical protein
MIFKNIQGSISCNLFAVSLLALFDGQDNFIYLNNIYYIAMKLYNL